MAPKDCCGLVVDSMLGFLTQKMDILPTDTLVKLCIGAYTDEEIKVSKDLLFDMCSDKLLAAPPRHYISLHCCCQTELLFLEVSNIT